MSIRMLATLATLALVAASMGAANAQAQAAPAPVTDVAPPRAEERNSAGAVVLENSPVPAQRSKAAESPASPGASAVGRGVMRATKRAQTRADRASARAAKPDLQRRRAASRTDN